MLVKELIKHKNLFHYNEVPNFPSVLLLRAQQQAIWHHIESA